MNKDVPYVVFESVKAMWERTIRRLWILVILLVVLFVATNAYWIWYESQFETVETTTTQEVDQDVDTGNGDATVIGIGSIYGESETEN